MGVILVTGASRGIGRGIALELAANGHRIAIHYNRNTEAAEEVVKKCRELCAAFHGDSIDPSMILAESFKADISSADEREQLVLQVEKTFGEIDGLVNNAGIAPRKRDDIIEAEEDVFDEVLRVNLYGPYFLTQRIARGWLASGQKNAAPQDSALNPPPAKRIVFVTSTSAEIVSVSRGEYCISKAGLGMAAQLFAARLAADGIYVFEVRPGIIQTDMTAGVAEKYTALIKEDLVPQRRWGYPRDVGTIVKAVMDGNLDFSTGSVIYSDGGLHISRL